MMRVLIAVSLLLSVLLCQAADQDLTPRTVTQPYDANGKYWKAIREDSSLYAEEREKMMALGQLPPAQAIMRLGYQLEEATNPEARQLARELFLQIPGWKEEMSARLAKEAEAKTPKQVYGAEFFPRSQSEAFLLVPKVRLWNANSRLATLLRGGESGSMRSRYRVHEPERAHFITSTITGWLPVFTSPACCEILAGSFTYCREHKQMRLHGWVIMENHFHAIVTAPALPAVMADLKKFTARRLLAQLASEGRDWLLRLLAEGKAGHKAGSQYQVWQEGYHPQAIHDDAMMIQKLDYIHHNPVRRGWVASPEHWRWSSAHEWLAGATPVMQCDPWK